MTTISMWTNHAGEYTNIQDTIIFCHNSFNIQWQQAKIIWLCIYELIISYYNKSLHK